MAPWNGFGSKQKSQLLHELAMAKDEVKARLAPIPVYTVANPKNEFVLVAGERGSTHPCMRHLLHDHGCTACGFDPQNNTQLGFFFFKKEDAEAIVEKWQSCTRTNLQQPRCGDVKSGAVAQMREENPRLARDSKILKVTMDNVYEVFTTPRDVTGLQGIHFRFMPDMHQVKHALQPYTCDNDSMAANLQLYSDAGVPTKQFIGVPVFQAEGLTVTTQEMVGYQTTCSSCMQYVPLFLAKEDLDIAVQSAYKQRNAAQIKLYRDKAIKFDDEYNQVQVQANSAAGREKTSLETRANKAKQKADVAKEKADNVERAPMPKVEVGSFEEVMMRMTSSTGDDLASWSQVMFVAPGLLQQAVLKEEQASTSKK
eukprot:363771-Chlamydomonas_euryale.AAC.12